MHPLYPQADALVKDVIDAASAVQRHFGIGLLESIYVKALARELEILGHTIAEEVPCVINYRGRVWEEKLRADLIIDDCFVIEAKAIDPCPLDRFRMQLLSYLKLLNLPLGLVINFGDDHLVRHGIKRVILKGADEPDVSVSF